MQDNKNSGILVFAEQKNGEIHNISYELLGKAKKLNKKLGKEVSAIFLTDQDNEVQELIYHGADKVYVMKDEKYQYPDEMLYKKNIVRAVKEIKPEIFLIGATAFGRSLAPRIAAAIEAGLTADCTDLKIDEDESLIQVRPAFSGNILAHIKSNKIPQMATVRYKEFEKPRRNPDLKGIIEYLDTKDRDFELKIEELKKNKLDITEANVIVAGGMGLEKAEDFELLKELAAKLNGVVGASRDVVDEGYIGHEHQVGYSGARVKPTVYIACGISGATQHIVGMKDSEYIIAINRDPSAPIFNVADIGIVGDLYEIVPELIESL